MSKDSYLYLVIVCKDSLLAQRRSQWKLHPVYEI